MDKLSGLKEKDLHLNLNIVNKVCVFLCLLSTIQHVIRN